MRHTRRELRAAKKLNDARDYLADTREPDPIASDILLACLLCVKDDMEVQPIEAVKLWHSGSPDLETARLVNAL